MTEVRRHSLAQWAGLFKRSVAAWSDDYAPSMGAALSYYSVFSMAPLMLLVISIAGLIFGQDAARGELFTTLEGLMGAEAAKTLQEMLSAMSRPSHGLAGTAISVGVLVIGATTVFGELQDALDRIWRAPDRVKKGGLWGLLRSRVLSFGMVLGIAFLLMVSLVLTAALSALGRWWGGFFGEWELLLQAVNLLVGYLLTGAGFALIYKFMPRVRVQWRDVIWGAALTSLLFSVGKFLIGLYIGKTGVASGFGAAGSIAVIFVWVYYSAQIFLLGAEFTWIYAQSFGSLRGDVPATANAPLPSRGAAAPSLPA
jgi:membrane protein